ncbi:MAG: hypothetical protein AB1726_16245 [Planctomycetota bacterium]
MRPFALLSLVASTTACAAATAPTAAERPAPDAPAAADLDPRQGEVPLPSAVPDWYASLVVDNAPTGIWTVEAVPFFAHHACPEVIGLDDRGRCLVCVSYSGKWTPRPAIEDGKWLGGLAHADVDPRLAGAELYTGGELGNLYQVVAYENGAMDCRRIACLPGCEIHTIVAGELDPASAGPELLVFTQPGGLYRVTPTGPDGTFETALVAALPGRVRDALVLPDPGGGPPEIATVSRAGWLRLLRMTASGPEWTTVHEGPMGEGRLDVAPPRPGRGTVLYTGLDDGRVLRHERGAGGAWRTETIYLGPQGVRGLAAGRFHADPGVETIAVFGYAKKVQILARIGEEWEVETIFVDRDKGHWLAAAELDGRNATDELLASGYGARIVLLSRPPGYGRSELTER